MCLDPVEECICVIVKFIRHAVVCIGEDVVDELAHKYLALEQFAFQQDAECFEVGQLFAVLETIDLHGAHVLQYLRTRVLIKHGLASVPDLRDHARHVEVPTHGRGLERALHLPVGDREDQLRRVEHRQFLELRHVFLEVQVDEVLASQPLLLLRLGPEFAFENFVDRAQGW